MNIKNSFEGKKKVFAVLNSVASQKKFWTLKNWLCTSKLRVEKFGGKETSPFSKPLNILDQLNS